MLLAACLSARRGGTIDRPRTGGDAEKSTTGDRRLFLTLYRSSIYYLTFVAILAVDFDLFPRRFCKTEVAGYGLMDLGAASFCISGGIVSGRGWNHDHRNGKGKGNGRWDSLKPLVRAAPLVAIGIVRTVANKELDYQEHASEYGVHWNFFFTLGVLAVVQPLRKRILLGLGGRGGFAAVAVAWAPVVAMLAYQHGLSARGWQSFVETAPRGPPLGGGGSTAERFFFANREGILGCIGYVFLHASGEWIGRCFVFVDDNRNEDKDERGGSTQKQKPSMGKLAIALWVLWWVLSGRGGTEPLGGGGNHEDEDDGYYYDYFYEPLPVSRRSTNLAFCVWALAHNVALLWAFGALETWLRTSSRRENNNAPVVVPPTWAAVNRHGMIAFLVANLLTGLVNLTVPTIDTGDGPALCLLVAYLAGIGAAVHLCDRCLGRPPRRDPLKRD